MNPEASTSRFCEPKIKKRYVSSGCLKLLASVIRGWADSILAISATASSWVRRPTANRGWERLPGEFLNSNTVYILLLSTIVSWIKARHLSVLPRN
jgi:hypothetical protein